MSDLRGHLQEIYDLRGRLKPEDVVEAARDSDHPLHSRFEWDDTTAGEKWRRHQAHELIQSVKVVFKTRTGQPRDVRAFHAIRSEKDHVYEPVERIVEDDVKTRILLQDMEREWRSLKKRYEQFEEFYDMIRRDLSEAA